MIPEVDNTVPTKDVSILVVIKGSSLLTPVYEVFSLWRFMPYYLLPLGMVLGLKNGRDCRKTTTHNFCLTDKEMSGSIKQI
jgi:hypothetical protein